MNLEPCKYCQRRKMSIGLTWADDATTYAYLTLTEGELAARVYTCEQVLRDERTTVAQANAALVAIRPHLIHLPKVPREIAHLAEPIAYWVKRGVPIR